VYLSRRIKIQIFIIFCKIMIGKQRRVWFSVELVS
jgi:hypothetical protein